MVFCVEYGTSDLDRPLANGKMKPLRVVCSHPERLSWNICWLCGSHEAIMTANGHFGVMGGETEKR